MKIALVQIYNEAIKNYAEYSRIANVLYAKQHGYDYICWEKDLVPTYISSYYNKLLAIENVMNSENKYDWIFYLDVDAMVTLPNVALEGIIEKCGERELILGNDKNGSNNGVFLIKNTETMKKFIRECYEDRNFYHTETPEQSAMFERIKLDEYKDKLGLLPAQFFNAYIIKYNNMQYEEPLFDGSKSFVLHLQRLPNDKRESIFRDLLKQMHIICT